MMTLTFNQFSLSAMYSDNHISSYNSWKGQDDTQSSWAKNRLSSKLFIPDFIVIKGPTNTIKKMAGKILSCGLEFRRPSLASINLLQPWTSLLINHYNSLTFFQIHHLQLLPKIINYYHINNNGKFLNRNAC